MSGRVSARYCTDLNNLSHILRRQRRFSESDSCFQELIRLRIELSGPDHPEVARDGLGRAFMLRDWGALRLRNSN
ncbi:MAG: tetratricopeptide repeat protein [Lewinellaceae bacterium]|nr:tetratricopeptide repeat protein [Lewinellaceae bacterium]